MSSGKILIYTSKIRIEILKQIIFSKLLHTNVWWVQIFVFPKGQPFISFLINN